MSKEKKKQKKRNIIPIEFKGPRYSHLQEEAEGLGMGLSAYVRHLVITHQKRAAQEKDLAKRSA